MSSNGRALGVRVVIIAGMYHSGATLLDLLLGQNPKVVGLGEIYYLLKFGPNPACSCGAETRECVFWRETLEKTDMLPKNELREGLAAVLESFERSFGPERIMVDSSKTLEALELLRTLPNVELKVIHLVRDVRSWAVSLLERDRRDRESRNGAMSYLRGRVRTVTRGPMVRFLQWYRENRKIKRFLKEQAMPAIRIGYEELVLYSRILVPKVCKFIGIEESEAMYRPGGSQSHVAFGNPMRHQRDKLQGILYDNRWLLRTQWLSPSLVLQRPVMRYDSEIVYANVRYPATGRRSR